MEMARGGTGHGKGIRGSVPGGLAGAAFRSDRHPDGPGAPLAEPELAALLSDAHADLGRVCAWMEGEALPGGPAFLVKRARARLAAVRAYLAALDEDLPLPAAGEVPGSLAAAARRPRPPA